MAAATTPVANETESVGTRIRRLRLEAGVSQRELSGPGVSYAYVSRIEAGQREPSLKALRLLARKLRTTLEHLETGDPVPSAYRRAIRLAEAELSLRLEGASPQLVEELRQILREATDEVDAAATLRAQVAFGLALAETGQYADAVIELEGATVSAASSSAVRPDVYEALGDCYVKMGQPHRAVELFQHCLDELGDDDAGLRIRYISLLSTALSKQGERERSHDLLKDFAHRDGAALDVRRRVENYRSIARDRTGDDAVARMLVLDRASGLVDAVEEASGVGRAHLDIARLLIHEDDPAQATVHLAQAEKLLMLGAERRDVGLLRALESFAVTLDGNQDRGIELAQEALSDLEGEPGAEGHAWHALGTAQAAAGDIDAASESFRKAIDLLGEHGDWREGTLAARKLARALREAGRESEAFDVMEEATALTVDSMGRETRRSMAARRRGSSEAGGSRAT